MSLEHENEVTRLLRARCEAYEATSHEGTPLFKSMLSVCWLTHKTFLTSNRIPQPVLDSLNNLHGTVEDHWSKTHANYLDYARLLQQMGKFQEFLFLQLISDYGVMQFDLTNNQWLQNQAALIKHHRGKTLLRCEAGQQGEDDIQGRTVAAKEEQDFERLVVIPLEELLFDAEHAETLIIAAAEATEQHGRQTPGPRIRDLVDRCDWPGLAATLVKDRELMQALSELRENKKSPEQEATVITPLINKTLDSIKRTRDTYFAELSDSDPTTFTLTKHAIKLSLPSATEKPVAGTSRVAQPKDSKRQSLMARVRGIRDAIKGHLGESATYEDRHTDAESGSRGQVEPLIKTESEKLV